jgi:deoxyribodipyrimidine photo-lyase
MYDPVKQGYDHDPEGTFVRTWVPELANVKSPLIHEPWKLSPLEQREYHYTSGAAYPARIVEHQLAVRKAREILTTFRRGSEAKSAIQSTLHKHGSRASPRRRGKKPRATSQTVQANTEQLSLFSHPKE